LDVLGFEMSSILGARWRTGLALSVAVLLLTLASTAAAQATTIVVTSTGDGASTCPSASSCTLRGALEETANGDTVSIPAGTYTLNGSKGTADVRSNISIVGAGSGATTITASPAGGLLEIEGAEVKLSGITFKGGTAGTGGAKGYGGAIYNYESKLQISNSAFTGDTASGETTNASYDEGGYGGAIYSERGTLTISASSFSSNSADGGANGSVYDDGGYGGAIYSEQGTLTVTGCSFSGNTSDGGSKATGSGYDDGAGGGAIYGEEGTITITGSTFTSNSAEGGATDSATTGYAYGGYGGAIYTEDGTTLLTTSTLSSNSATGAGTTDAGAHYGEGGYGGGLYTEDGNAVVSSSALSSNTAGAGADGSGTNYGEAGVGGGIFAGYGSLTFSDDTVNGNIAARDTSGKGEGGSGGGLYTKDGEATIIGSAFSSNSATGGDGGGVFAAYEPISLNQSTIGPDNTAEYGGGLDHAAGPAAITNSTIAENTAAYEGGGIYNEGAANLANVSLVANKVEHVEGGGNLYLDEDTMTLHDSLIAAGGAPTSGGNCAFDTGSGFLESQGYNAESANECKLGGTGDLIKATLDLGPLQSNGGPTPTIALGSGSQAIDAGDPAGCTDAEGNPLTVDQRGVSRPQGSRCDIGAFEVEVPPAPAPKSAPAPTSTPKPSPASIASFATSIGVKLSSGVGTLSAGCEAPADEACTFTLTLYASVKGGHASSVKRVKVGTATGKIQGGRVGKLTVKLNATGRKYLAHGTLHLEAVGTIKDSAGLITTFHRHITVKAIKKKK
jgi:hypothetical protein